MPFRKIDYDEVQSPVYAAGRAVPPAGVEAWMDAFADHWQAPTPLALLDLGSGIGRFTPALAERFGGPISGVEPSVRMREIAQTQASHPRVSYLPGEAAAIPLERGTVDGALMFLSLHHVPDLKAAAREIARVLRPGGVLQIVSGFRDRPLGASWWHQFFPSAEAVERRMFPPVDQVVDNFAAAGLSMIVLDHVRTQLWDSVVAAADQLRLRPYSTFEHLTEEEIVAGQARLDRMAAAASGRVPIIGESDRMVLRASR